jgi:hypothetical protein
MSSQNEEAKAGAFAYWLRRQKLELSLTGREGKSWSFRLLVEEAKAGAFAY